MVRKVIYVVAKKDYSEGSNILVLFRFIVEIVRYSLIT